MRATLAQFVERAAVPDPDFLDDQRDAVRQAEDKLRDPSLSVARRSEFERRRREALAQLERFEAGITIDTFHAELWEDPKSRSALVQLLDRDRGEKYEFEKWDQAKWQAESKENAKSIKDSLSMRIGRELASPSRSNLSAETLGLVEVVYPGLDAAEPDDGFLGRLTKTARENLRAIWPDLLRAFCDLIRSEGGITLGSDELDDEYSFDRAPIGRWCVKETDGYELFALIGKTERQGRRRFGDRILKKAGIHGERSEGTLPDAAFDGLRSTRGIRSIRRLPLDQSVVANRRSRG